MSRSIAFRLSLIAVWMLPLAIWSVDVAQFMATPHTTRIVAGPPVTANRLMLEQLSSWLGWVALVAGLLATGGLWAFRRWAISLFAVGLLAYAGYVGLCDFYFEYTLLPQLALLVQGVGLGGIAAWLRLARQTLPFDARLNSG
jgi:hypothetical protein